jgi:pimeloyl-ACP methyl ester carboxylesterase
LKPPAALLAITEAPRALADAAMLQASAPFLRRMPTGNGHGVMIIPGFLGEDEFNKPFVRYLNKLGYKASGWGQGRNLGPGSFSEDALRHVLEMLALRGNGKVSLIGHSLGGIYAREIARTNPEAFHQVITLGSPFSQGRDSGSHASRLYKRLNPDNDPRDEEDLLATPPPVPTTAIYTKGDGVVNWRTSLQHGYHRHVDNIEVKGSHIGLTLNASVWYQVAKKLAAVA